MIPDVKISRAWFSGTQNTLVWSDEGIIASPSRENISLFVSVFFFSISQHVFVKMCVTAFLLVKKKKRQKINIHASNCIQLILTPFFFNFGCVNI